MPRGKSTRRKGNMSARLSDRADLKKRQQEEKKKEAVVLRLGVDALARMGDQGADTAALIRAMTLHSDTVPALIDEAKTHVADLKRMIPPLSSARANSVDFVARIAPTMDAARDAIARAAVLSEPFLAGKVTALKKLALSGSGLHRELTPRLSAQEYGQLWRERRITPTSGPTRKSWHNINCPPGSALNDCWPSDVMTPIDYSLYKLDTAVKLLDEAREGLDIAPVVQELPDDAAGSSRRRRTRRRKNQTKGKRVRRSRGGA